MNDHDVTAVLERLIEPLDDELGNWDDVRRRAAEPPADDWNEAVENAESARGHRRSLEYSSGRYGRRRHSRRVLVLAAAALVVVGATAAFATARGLFFGSARTAFDDPIWSPDGRRIAFLHRWADNRRFGIEIHVMNADGSGEWRLARGYAPAWSPDGRKIAFESDPCASVQLTCGVRTAQINVMNADGSGARALARGVTRNRWSQPAGVSPSPAWSPDARKIAFVSNRGGGGLDVDVYVMNADGSGEQRLTHTPESDGAPVWSPDGRKIAFARSIRDRSGRLRREEIYVMNADGTGQRALGRGGGPPSWSPDGRRIAFRSERTGKAELYVVNPDGSGLVRLTRNPAAEGDPVWSPDGKKIYFVRGWHGKTDVYAMNADGSGQRNLSRYPGPLHKGGDNSPAVSPNGRRIAFVRGIHPTSEIYVMNADGRGLKRLTHGP